MQFLVDKFGREIHANDWFIRCDKHHEGRLYLCEGYAPDGRIHVHEHDHEFSYNPTSGLYTKTNRIVPKRLKQTVRLPRSCIWYPESLIPEIASREQ